MSIYMKYEGIEGEVTGKYKGWIELDVCQIVRNTGGGGSIYKPDVFVVKDQDNVSIELFNEFVANKGKKVTVDFVEGAEAPFMSIEMEGVTITNITVSGRGGSDKKKPIESITLKPTKISQSAKPTDRKSVV